MNTSHRTNAVSFAQRIVQRSIAHARALIFASLTLIATLLTIGCAESTSNAVELRSERQAGIGTITSTLTDEKHFEAWTVETGDVRRFVMQIWYPCERNARGAKAAYMNDLVASRIDRMNLPKDFYRHVAPIASIGAPPADNGSQRWPVIIFSHDIGLSREVYTTLITTLVDRGFVVVAINHPYLAAATTFDDGKTAIGRDPLAKPSPEAAEPQWEDYLVQLHEFLGGEADVWSADIQCAINELARRNEHSASTFHDRLDLVRIGVMGHGFGAAAAANAALDDERIVAWVNLDGRLYGRAEQNPPTQPAMLIAPTGIIDEDPSRSALWAGATTWIVRAELSHIGRLSVTDLGVLQQRFNCQLDTETFGTAEPAWAIRMTAELLTAFFGQTLANEPSALFTDDRPTSPWPGVTITVRAGLPTTQPATQPSAPPIPMPWAPDAPVDPH